MTSAGSEDPDARLWRIVAATVRPLRRRLAAKPRAAAVGPSVSTGAAAAAAPAAPVKPLAASRPRQPAAGPRMRPAPEPIEPGRRRRLERGRDEPAATLDLHGLNQDRARVVLTAFLLRAFAEHRRTLMVITGKGALGGGVLRRRVPEWLAEPPLRAIVAGVSEAHRRHGGEGALYLALKRSEGR